MTTVTSVSEGSDNSFGASQLSALAGATLFSESATQFVLTGSGFSVTCTGTGFTFSNGAPTGGTLTGLSIASTTSAITSQIWTNFSLSVATVWNAITTGNVTSFDSLFFGGNSAFVSNNNGGTNTFIGFGGSDFFEISRGNNTIDGGAGFNTLSFADSDAPVTVNLGTGIATAGGTDSIQNIQWVIASSFNSTLTAGSTAATLQGGAGNDTLVGGAGNDTLIAGTGGGTMTGGGGNNTFIYSVGGKQYTVTDFGANGDQDVLDIYGYASAESITQQGANTLITLSGSDSILLDDVQASSLTNSNLVFNSTAYAGPIPPVSLPVYGTQPIDFTSDLTINTGEQINIDGYPSGLIDDGAGEWFHSVTNFGSITVSTQSGPITGLSFNLGQGLNDMFTNELGAIFSVSDTSTGLADFVVGVASGDGPDTIAFVNNGTFTVTGVSATWGLELDAPFTNAKTGTITVTSSSQTAGLAAESDSPIENDGLMTISGGGSGIVWGINALDFGFTPGSSIVNNGSITVTTSGSGPTYGIDVSGFSGTQPPGTINNTGTISAQTAIQDSSTLDSSAPWVAITNSGLIDGNIVLEGTHSSLTNTGTIDGNVLLHDNDLYATSIAAGDTIDLRGGTFSGYIAISPGVAYGDPDPPTNDTIYTDSGTTLIMIAGGESNLSATIWGGVGGQTTVQFDVASTAATETYNTTDGTWTVSAGGDGTETLFNVQNLQFTDKTIVLPSPSFVADDFYGAGTSNILWQNNSTGQVAVWQMNGATPLNKAIVGAVSGGWSVAGVGDFYASGHADILWQNSSSDQVALWEMNGSTVQAEAIVGSVSNGWNVAGTGDFYGTGHAAILWQNLTGGQVALWEMNGTTVRAETIVGTVSSGWSVAGTGNFYGPGDDDILWSNSQTGQVAIWQMNGSNVQAETIIGAVSGGWQVAGTGDFYGNGDDDILWQDQTTGQVALWEMNGSTVQAETIVGAVSAGWQIAEVGHISGGADADILWQNTNTGQVALWAMNGATPSSETIVGVVSGGWTIPHNALAAGH